MNTNYEPGYRPWVAFSGGLSNPQTPTAEDSNVSTLTATQNAATKLMPGWALGLGIGLLAVAALGAVAYGYMGYYVGKKLGTNWGWFWGFGGPVGIAIMQGYRQSKGRVAKANRKWRRR